MKERWWEAWEGLWDAEVNSLLQYGASANFREEDGVRIIETQWPIDGRAPMRLEIGFSPLHPFFRPEVAAPDEQLPRHQHPITKSLCLLTQEFGQWNFRQHIGDFLAERIPVLMQTLQAREEKRLNDAAAQEENAPDPWMPYYVPENSNVALFSGSLKLPAEDVGIATFQRWMRPELLDNATAEFLFGQLRTPDGRILEGFSIPNTPQPVDEMRGIWIKLAKPPFTTDPNEILAVVRARIGEIAVLRANVARQISQVLDAAPNMVAILFPEEVRYGVQGTGALFVATFQDHAGGPAQSHLLRGERASEEDLFARFPVAKTLRKKSALLVGCGAIGSFVAMELARAGIGRMTLFDRDIVQPGNSLRWPLGRPVWGAPKVLALVDAIVRNYPFTQIEAKRAGLELNWQPESGNKGAGPLSELKKLIRDHDIVIDAAASLEVQHALSHLSRTLGKTYIVGHAQMGLASGLVARFPANAKACWVCLQQAINSGAIVLRIDESKKVVPVGCNDPTFAGGSFDLEELSLELARSAIGYLSEGAFDPGAWPVSVLELVDDTGKRVLPRWAAHDLVPHADCCGAAA